MQHGIRIEAAILVAIVLAAVIPFSDRAVFSDEHIYLRIAQSALTKPLYPQDTPAKFFGNVRANYMGHTHPPAVEYYIAAIYAALGKFSEIPFRLLFAVFPIMAVLAFYSLARRFVSEPFFVSALFAVSPAFFVFAPTLMMDVPMIGLLLAGLALYFRGKLVPAGVCFTLSLGTGYAVIVPLFCLGLIMLASKRPWKEIACVVAAPVALALWLVAMTIHFGASPLGQMVGYMAVRSFGSKTVTTVLQERVVSIVMNLLATLSFLGGVLIFPGMIRLRNTRSILHATLLALVLSLIVPMPSLLYRAWFIVLATCGIMLLTAFAGAAIQIVRSGGNGGEPILILWAPVVLVFYVVAGEIMAARYLLLAMPAIFLVVFRESRRSDLIATIVPTAVLSLILAYADMSFVNSYRTWVQESVPKLQEQGFRVYGEAEAGLRFYLEKSGADVLITDDRRPVGSDIIIGQEMYAYALGNDIPVVLTELKRFPLEGRFPIRTYSKSSHAGFWDNSMGLVPYVFSSEPYDTIIASQVNPLVKRFPQDSTDPEKAPVYGSPNSPLFRLSENERVFPMQIPRNIQIQYDVVGGTGAAEQTPEGLKLIKKSGATIDWRGLRFMPQQWMDSQ
jgi:4-amino-4-deoxy-L-arabinose transferase-like glycosyltransferase